MTDNLQHPLKHFTEIKKIATNHSRQENALKPLTISQLNAETGEEFHTDTDTTDTLLSCVHSTANKRV